MNTTTDADGEPPMNWQGGTNANLVDLNIKTEYNPNDLGRIAPGISPRLLSAFESISGSVAVQAAPARQRIRCGYSGT
jgi:hypothetical protein